MGVKEEEGEEFQGCVFIVMIDIDISIDVNAGAEEGGRMRSIWKKRSRREVEKGERKDK